MSGTYAILVAPFSCHEFSLKSLLTTVVERKNRALHRPKVRGNIRGFLTVRGNSVTQYTCWGTVRSRSLDEQNTAAKCAGAPSSYNLLGFVSAGVENNRAHSLVFARPPMLGICLAPTHSAQLTQT